MARPSDRLIRSRAELRNGLRSAYRGLSAAPPGHCPGMDITELILDDHHRQRQAFAHLDDIDRADTERLGLVWEQLADFLEVHAAAEEAVFYPELLKQADPDGAETKDAIGDHNDIRDGVAEASRQVVGSDAWWEAVGRARRANTEHMGEEEDEGLADFRRHASLELRDELGLRFEAAKNPKVADTLDQSDKDPDAYITTNS
jgi:Hemerythrin HHE cation binding domain